MSRRFTIALVVGAIAGYFAGVANCRLTSEKKALSSEHILERVKSAVNDQLPIEGAWIYLSPHIWSRDSLNYMVYKGGLISSDRGINRHFDFIADAHSGTILELTAQH
ncbi:hypothetical protein NIE88_03740 [Sporolactobacillus shoreicorticis]|uniref:PepSY domain-containing protein n=1 Tax=Sporolactobacillus shoreicorticis TaxID=1923877 RepID=A0ABW5RXH2_9BACL|nr:hypothetical protein [Sporolactobacillus shoreicorticis]MCO7124887.1 hypothetical protein [Sporolactobacillus shoreicorticis]